MTDPTHRPSLTRQSKLFGISWGSLSYEPRPTSDADLKLMRRIRCPAGFCAANAERGRAAHGTPVHGQPDDDGFAAAGRLHDRTTARCGLHENHRDRGTLSRAEHVQTTPGHKVYPYPLRKLAVTRPNQVRATDITYIPMACGLVYLVAVLDWLSRKVLAWCLSVRLETAPCLEGSGAAIRRCGKPAIMNSDQGSQFTSTDFIKAMKDAEIQISMPYGDCVQSPAGNGWQRGWRDNVFVERLWRSIKYEEVHLHAYESVSAARPGLARYLTFHNTRRPHSSLDGQTPDQASQFMSQPVPVAA